MIQFGNQEILENVWWTCVNGQFFFSCAMQGKGSSFPDQRWNRYPLQWNRRVSTTRPPGSPSMVSFKLANSQEVFFLAGASERSVYIHFETHTRTEHFKILDCDPDQGQNVMVFMRNIDRQMKSNLDFWILGCNYIVSVKSVLGLFVIF